MQNPSHREKEKIQSYFNSHATILVKLRTKDPTLLEFEPGDHIGIYPCNNPLLVNELFKRIKDVPNDSDIVKLELLQGEETTSENNASWIADKRLPFCSLWTAFSRYLDISSTPTPHLLKLLADCAENNEDKARLKLLSNVMLKYKEIAALLAQKNGGEEYDKWKFYKKPNLLEVFDEFPSLHVELSLLLSQLPLLQCRYYSISNSPDVHPNQIHCTISVVSYRTKGDSGPLHHGVCSTYMDKINQGDEVMCFIRPAAAFHLPSDPNIPCILVGPGTGIAPFRSFWQQRIHLIKQNGNKAGKMVLLFGCRHPSDHSYKEEVEDALKLGALTNSFTAYSRIPGKPKMYVQDIMEKQLSDFIFDIMFENSGHLYVCGDVTMANDVRKALKRIGVKAGKMTETGAEMWWQEIKSNKRYHEDIFGVTFWRKEMKKNIRSESRKNSAASH